MSKINFTLAAALIILQGFAFGLCIASQTLTALALIMTAFAVFFIAATALLLADILKETSRSR